MTDHDEPGFRIASWTRENIEVLREMAAGGARVSVIAIRLKRSYMAVRYRARREGDCVSGDQVEAFIGLQPGLLIKNSMGTTSSMVSPRMLSGGAGSGLARWASSIALVSSTRMCFD